MRNQPLLLLLCRRGDLRLVEIDEIIMRRYKEEMVETGTHSVFTSG